MNSKILSARLLQIIVLLYKLFFNPSNLFKGMCDGFTIYIVIN